MLKKEPPKRRVRLVRSFAPRQYLATVLLAAHFQDTEMVMCLTRAFARTRPVVSACLITHGVGFAFLHLSRFATLVTTVRIFHRTWRARRASYRQRVGVLRHVR
jgi:Zn-dependent membrane protease YugP